MVLSANAITLISNNEFNAFSSSMHMLKKGWIMTNYLEPVKFTRLKSLRDLTLANPPQRPWLIQVHLSRLAPF
jgi:hypothetical protein